MILRFMGDLPEPKRNGTINAVRDNTPVMNRIYSTLTRGNRQQYQNAIDDYEVVIFFKFSVMLCLLIENNMRLNNLVNSISGNIY